MKQYYYMATPNKNSMRSLCNKANPGHFTKNMAVGTFNNINIIMHTDSKFSTTGGECREPLNTEIPS